MSTSICAKAPGCSNGYRHTALGPVMDISRHARIRQWIYPLFEAPVFASDPRAFSQFKTEKIIYRTYVQEVPIACLV